MDVAMVINFVEKKANSPLVALAFRNGMGYRYLSVRINSVLLVRHGKKLVYLVDYLRILWTDFRC